MVEANSTLRGKNLLLCVCGGIAAYKAAELVRRLRDAGAEDILAALQSSMVASHDPLL